LSDFVEKRKLPRIEVRWPVTLTTENGAVEGEARNIAIEGVFIHCRKRLNVNETYRLLIKPAEEEIEVMAKLIWSNIESAADRDILLGMDFCFMRVSEAEPSLQSSDRQ
jgi:hypothetical protein